MANKRIMTLGFLLALAGPACSPAWPGCRWCTPAIYREIAYTQSVRRNVVAPMRGEILDRETRKLVVNADVRLAQVRPRRGGRASPGTARAS